MYLDRLSPEKKVATLLDAWERLDLMILESFARGTPVTAERLGAMATMIEDDVTGWLFEPGRATELARLVSVVGSG